MPDDLAFTMRTGRCDRVNGAFEAVEDHRAAVRADELESLVVVISAYFAFSHMMPPLVASAARSAATGRSLSERHLDPKAGVPSEDFPAASACQDGAA